MSSDGILLYAKQAGLTSFSSLWTIKNAAKTKKVGHTGTLDNFADGLLVVLLNSATRLVSHITDFDKTYEAIIRLGIETDTLDIHGTKISEKQTPTKDSFLAAIPQFVGKIEQVPPVYSALHVEGKRSSDLARSGKEVSLKKRPVEIYSIDLISFEGEYAHIRVHCSKGTYIRALARDIAYACNSCAHLVSLRRTSVGSFQLQDAVGYSLLPPFSIEEAQKKTIQSETEKPKEQPSFEQVHKAISSITPLITESCGFRTLHLRALCTNDFFNGKKLNENWFLESFKEVEQSDQKIQFAVFTEKPEVHLCGVISRTKYLSYDFVVPLRGKI